MFLKLSPRELLIKVYNFDKTLDILENAYIRSISLRINGLNNSRKDSLEYLWHCEYSFDRVKSGTCNKLKAHKYTFSRKISSSTMDIFLVWIKQPLNEH